MDLVAAGRWSTGTRLEHLHLLQRVREVVSVYLACARITAGTLYADGVLDAVEALTGSREATGPAAALLEREDEAAGQAVGPLLEDCEARLDEIRQELLEEVGGAFERDSAEGGMRDGHPRF